MPLCLMCVEYIIWLLFYDYWIYSHSSIHFDIYYNFCVVKVYTNWNILYKYGITFPIHTEALIAKMKNECHHCCHHCHTSLLYKLG